ncbi:CRISPR-associated protein, APE2256 family [Thermosyntropha lipolytica DSM 11003]|uniref:CRISPR-associated protein, APE2256 family n=1 Tax=Thermosyntropha lipolytica DSM 11003 TaxID=1123382 RepID=A0A1M5RKN3_9FIRM|nr:putative CRISPR-associated protein [Thermosyntropha lipolytica]SHH26771.1 CRISPR-associated protein, APE2256 family [Thermosyntropha lipolytica DSM 11003]
MRKILCTVGTSLLTNCRREGGENQEEFFLLSFIEKKGEALASAETNSLSRILEPGDQIVFLYSQTREGKICADTLQSYYEKKGVKSRIKEIDNLSYAHSTFATRGLKSLIDTLIEEIRLSRRQDIMPVINATGGFKAEIAYATLVGLIFKVPVYYIHEVFQDVIAMPSLPVDWDPSLFVEYGDFFNWISSEFRRKEKVARRLKELPGEINLFLEEDEEGYITLSPAGTVYYEAFCDLQREADKVMISDRALAYYKRLDSTVQQTFRRLLKRLAIEQVRKSYSRRVDTSDCLDYPFSRGTKERIFFYDDGEQVYICELARHGDNYEELLQKGVKRENYRNFEEMKL